MDLSKHASLFEPAPYKGAVTIIGCGATGSALFLQLAKLGIEEIAVYDGDVIEQHNIPNQVLYGPDDVGQFKVEVARERIKTLTGNRHDCHTTMWKPNVTERRPVTFVCVDTMFTRKEIWAAHKFSPKGYYSDGRMDSRTFVSLGFPLANMVNLSAYEETLYDDKDVPVDTGTCGNVLSIAATASALTAAMTWQFINFSREHLHSNEIQFQVDRWSSIWNRSFND